MEDIILEHKSAGGSCRKDPGVAIAIANHSIHVSHSLSEVGNVTCFDNNCQNTSPCGQTIRNSGSCSLLKVTFLICVSLDLKNHINFFTCASCIVCKELYWRLLQQVFFFASAQSFAALLRRKSCDHLCILPKCNVLQRI